MLLLLLSCPDPQSTPVDLTERLGPGEARAGNIVDEASLFGGISAEGQLGDYLLYNDRVRFIVQGPRAGHYYVGQAGGVVDADMVRPEGALGRDMVDDWCTTMSVLRIAHATGFAVVDDGRLSGTTHLRVWGHESPFELITGAVEDPGFVSDTGVDFVTDYVLPADSWVLEVSTTFTATEDEITFAPGDMLQASLDAGGPWTPGAGRTTPELGSYPWLGFSGQRGDGAVALVALEGVLQVDASAGLVGSLARMVVGAAEPVTLASGESVTWARGYAVGPDLGTITPGETVEGEAPDGAEIAVYADGDPWTLAKAVDGAWTAHVPPGAAVETLTMGRGKAVFAGYPEGWTSYSALGADPVRERTLESLSTGSVAGMKELIGWGVGDLVEPGSITVRVAEGGPFELQVRALDPQPEVDSRVVPGRPDGLAALGWAQEGEVTVLVEPGEHDLLVHRGIRFEIATETVTVASGEAITVELSLEEAYVLPDWLAGDPHSHAAPSGDGSCSMEDRIAVSAARGIQVHFGTDHDMVADYRPIVGALDLSAFFDSVVASEVSPVLRGHVNAYPLTMDRSQPSGSNFLWYSEPVDSTEEQFSLLRERFPGVLLQLNHPVDGGVGSSAGWSPGEIGKPDFWTEDFDAVEVINAASLENWAFYLDLVNHGLLSTPVSVSDSHGCTSGRIGLNVTFLPFGEYSDEGLRQIYAERSTVASMGPFIQTSILPGSELTGAQTLVAEALSPSWIVVDELVLLQDGEEVQVVEGTEATFSLFPEQDASFIVVARGSTDMSPVWPGRTPWAMTSPILIDIDGDGWDAPLGFGFPAR